MNPFFEGFGNELCKLAAKKALDPLLALDGSGKGKGKKGGKRRGKNTKPCSEGPGMGLGGGRGKGKNR